MNNFLPLAKWLSEIPRNMKNWQQLLDAKYCSCLIAVMAHHRLWKTLRHLLPSLIWSEFIIQPPSSLSHFPLCSLTIQPFISHLYFFLNSTMICKIKFIHTFYCPHFHVSFIVFITMIGLALAYISSQTILQISGALLFFIFFLINRYIITRW